MEIIKKVEKITRVVVTGKKVTATYKARDGKEFKVKKECISYEEKLKLFDSIKHMKIDQSIFDVAEEWYKPETNEQLEALLSSIGYYTDITVYINNTEFNKSAPTCFLNEWISYKLENGGDYGDHLYLYTLSYIIDELKDFFKNFQGSIFEEFQK